MTQVHAALYGKKAKVEESAMVYNYDSKSDTEIDILITFQMGGNTYRTAIECQERSRSAGRPWISELKAKRDGCRLDKIIAVHSKGFTTSAKTQANTFGIEILTPKQIIAGDDFFEKIKPYTKLMFQISKCKFPNGIVFSFEKGPLPKKIEAGSSSLIFPGHNKITFKEFEKGLREIVRSDWVSEKYDLSKINSNKIKENTIIDKINVNVFFPYRTIIRFTDGTELCALSAKANGEVTLTTKFVKNVKHVSPKDGILATCGELNLIGEKANLVLTQEREKRERGICMNWEGGTISGKTQIDRRLIGNIQVEIKKV
jgi:hypothetical protein